MSRPSEEARAFYEGRALRKQGAALKDAAARRAAADVRDGMPLEQAARNRRVSIERIKKALGAA